MSNDFRNLHTPGDPLVLYNIWDAGSAASVANAKPHAIATGSWAMAKAQGYDDGEEMPFPQVAQIVAQIVKAVDLPVTVDFETGYAGNLETLRANIDTLLSHDIVGVNFEDRLIAGSGLRDTQDQCARIKVLRQASQDLFINARCDLMFDGSKPDIQAERIDDLLERAKAYADSGADGLFVPGLATPDLIEDLCKRSPLPVNIMRMDDTPISELAALGVARISHGPRPYMQLMKALSEQAKTL
jgi:2-methylisocitrate lyase-like PEP mutase family enzyme